MLYALVYGLMLILGAYRTTWSLYCLYSRSYQYITLGFLSGHPWLDWQSSFTLLLIMEQGHGWFEFSYLDMTHQVREGMKKMMRGQALIPPTRPWDRQDILEKEIIRINERVGCVAEQKMEQLNTGILQRRIPRGLAVPPPTYVTHYLSWATVTGQCFSHTISGKELPQFPVLGSWGQVAWGVILITGNIERPHRPNMTHNTYLKIYVTPLLKDRCIKEEFTNPSFHKTIPPELIMSTCKHFMPFRCVRFKTVCHRHSSCTIKYLLIILHKMKSDAVAHPNDVSSWTDMRHMTSNVAQSIHYNHVYPSHRALKLWD